MPPRRVRRRLVLAAAACLLLPVAARGEAGGRASVGPRENASYVRDDARWLREAMAAADRAAGEGDWAGAVRAWQSIVEVRRDPDDPASAAPDVWAVEGTRVYEGAGRVAHHRILAAGDPALRAYDREVGGLARALLARAAARHDPQMLAEVVDRFLPHDAGRRAALVLVDLALERGDADAALGWLERLEDVEEVTAESEEHLAPWRTDRLHRLALALAGTRGAAVLESELAAAAAPGADPDARYRLVATDDPERVREEGWPMPGGRPDRAAVAPALGGRLELAWWEVLVEGPRFARTRSGADDRPSPWIPPRAVVAGDLAFVHDGNRIGVWRIEGKDDRTGPGQLVARYELREREWFDLGEDPRSRWGLIEGHALTLGPQDRWGRLVYAAVTDPRPWSYQALSDDRRDDHLLALRWTGTRLYPVWRAGGLFPTDRDGLPEGIRLYGSPVLYGGRLWVAGVRAIAAAESRLEAWVFGLAPQSGRVEVRTFLGSGNPVRNLRADEAIPSAPAAAHGRVVVVTALGIAAAVDARDGRVQWSLRYDRDVGETGRPRRLSDDRDPTERPASFVNQAPLLVWDRAYVAPTDASTVYALYDRPRGPDRDLVSWPKERTLIASFFTVEQLAGVHDPRPGAPPLVLLVGKGRAPEGEPPPPTVVAARAETLYALDGWASPSPTGWGAEPAGHALVTAGEVFVPTEHGIAVYALEDGRNVALLSVDDAPEALRRSLPVGLTPYGNLVPVPGRGVLAVGATTLAYWRRTR